jgi:hypothetical protein
MSGPAGAASAAPRCFPGRSAVFFIAGERGDPDRFYMAVTYHRQIRGETRQLSISPKLLARVLRE